jgi:DNA-binding IscR family transcriptional regulator
VLVSVKGPNGGYRLSRPASTVSMLEIVEAVDGPIRGQSPLSEDEPGRTSRSSSWHAKGVRNARRRSASR